MAQTRKDVAYMCGLQSRNLERVHHGSVTQITNEGYVEGTEENSKTREMLHVYESECVVQIWHTWWVGMWCKDTM